MQSGGKRESRASVASIAAGSLTLHDASSNKTFLIDTGAEVSVVPATEQERRKAPMEKELVAANGSRIRCYGEKKVRFHVGSRTYEWKFLVADVKRSLIGADFLTHSSLLVDLRNKQMVHPDDLNATPLQQTKHRSRISGLTFAASARPSPLSKLFAEFPTVTVPNFKIEHPKHAVRHTIETRGQPIRAKARPLPPQKLAAAKANFAEMAASGIVRRSNGPWSSPLHVVTKKDGSFRMCGDYRRLNTVTTPDRYSIPLIADLTSRLQGKKFFGKVDLVKGYHQIPVAEQDIAKTAITTPFGTYEFLRMPFGLKNAGQTFQRMMDEILSDLDYLFVYMDDVLVASRSMEEHLEHFRELFRRLTAHDLVVSPAKCQFGKTQIEFLGHTVTKDGIQPLPEKVAAINAYPVPSSMDELRRFLGMVNFYNRFIPNAAKIMKPLYEATMAENCRKQKNGKERACTELKTSKKLIEWNDEMRKAFLEAKTALAKATILRHPRPGAEIALSTDASGEAIGAVLQQRPKEGGDWEPLAYFSKKLNPPERKYSAFDRELLAVYLGVRHFRHYLEGRDFPIFTDHRPLTFAMAKAAEPWSHRQARHLEYISQYSTDIRYVAGADNAVADALSRAAIEEIRLGIDFSKMAELQRQDPETRAYKTSVTALRWEEIEVSNGQQKLLCDVATGVPRPLVPAAMRREVFDLVHGLSHPGTTATVKIMKNKFVWHGIAKDVRAWARACIGCQTAKIHRHNRAPLTKFERATARFAHVHVDLVGPLPASKGHTHLLTVIDRFTRWPEAIPLAQTDTASIGRAFALHWVARFGVPSDITSDRGAQFTSDMWKALAESLGSKIHHTTAYHPQSNGLVERFHRSLKAALRARLTTPSWLDELPWVMLGLRTTPKEDLGTSVAEMVYGSTLTVPGTFVGPSSNSDAAEHLQNMRNMAGRLVPAPDAWHGTKAIAITKGLDEAEYVFVRRDASHSPLQTPYTGPYKVLQKQGKYFVIQCGEREESVSIDRLKPVNAEPDRPTEPAMPPRRGRPPKQREERSAAERGQAEARPEPEQEQQAPSYAQVTRRGRTVRPPDRYIATTRNPGSKE